MATITQVNTFTNSTTGLRGIATSSTGSIMYALYNNSGYSIYQSTDSNGSWNEIIGSDLSVNGNYQGITTNSDGTKLYAIWNVAPIYYSSNSGVNWITIPSTGLSNPNLTSIATDSTGTNLITCLSTTIYISTNSGTTFTSVHTGSNIQNVACSSNFGIYYYATNNGTVYRSTSINNNIWTSLPAIVGNDNCSNMTCSADGSKVFLTDNASQLFLFSEGSWTTIATTGFGQLSSYLNGSRLLTSTGTTTFTTYNFTYPSPPPYPCFKEDSKILCYKDGKVVYRNVQDLRKGDLVKTLRNGYVAVDMIGTTKLQNGKANQDKNMLYRCSKEKYPELTEDLIITGHHSILVSNITDEQRGKIIDVMGKIYITDNKYRLAACIDDRAKPYDKEGQFNIWHIALENSDYYMNYGIYANGLLVETCSRRYLKEISGMNEVVEK
jgi:hypothetical protein